MGKIRAEICLISARGLRRSSSLWKLHWYAVGWVDPKDKYCTKVDTSGSTNPSWRTKFPVLIDDESNQESLALHVQVYSRDAIFLRERLQGIAVVLLKEFLATNKEQVGSFQLRNKSGKQAQGFVDISVCISGNEDVVSPYPPYLASPEPPYSAHPDMIPSGHAEIYQPRPHHPPMQQYPPPNNYYYANARPPPPPPGVAVDGPPPQAPPPPPPPSHVGYIPTFLPSAGGTNYVNIPSSSSSTGPGRGSGSDFGMGLGAGALAAGAVLFGDDFMSGFCIPSSLSLQDDDSLVVSMDPPF